MFSKIKIWFVKVSTTLKVIGSIISIVGSLYGGYKVVEKIMFNRYQRETLEISRWKKIDKLIESDSVKTLRDNTLINGFNELSGKVDRSDKTLSNLKAYMVNTAATKQDLKDIYNIFDQELKKNDLIKIQLKSESLK
jgi:hypothetical protein